MSIIYREPSTDASYQVSVHLAKWFQRRRFLEIDQSIHLAERFQRRLKCEKLTDAGRQVMAKAHIAFGKVS
jgi:hypothetical protein